MKREIGYYWCKWDGEWHVFHYTYCVDFEQKMFKSSLFGGTTDDGALFDEINETRILNPDEL